MNALILVDIQNDFIPGGALAVPEGDAVVPVVNRLQPHFDLIVATQDWHPANHGSFAANHPGKRPGDIIEINGLRQVLWPVHCVQNTTGAALAPGLSTRLLAETFQKGTDPGIDSYSGFFDNGHQKATGLGDFLKARKVAQVFVAGLATDYCVKFTALDAVALGFKTYVIGDACRGVNLKPGDVARAFEEMSQAGVTVLDSAQLVERMKEIERPKITLFTGRFIAFIREGHWEYVERVNATGAAIILAVTDQQKLLLVEQYRIPCHARVIELPAGVIGDEPGSPEEDPAEAARRELLEETGYEAEHMEPLTRGPASSGITSEIVMLFRATGLRWVGPGGGHGSEELTLHEVPLKEARGWLEAKARAGVLIDPKVYAGLYFLENNR